MALKLARLEPTGIAPEYWKIDSYMVGFNNPNHVVVVLALYLNAEARQAGSVDIKITSVTVERGEDMSRSALYTKIKALEEFDGALDC